MKPSIPKKAHTERHEIIVSSLGLEVAAEKTGKRWLVREIQSIPPD
jgi:hypothetical protein